MKNKEPKELGFTFQEIDLAEAQQIVSAGDGKYSDLIIHLSKKLPELDRSNVGLAAEERKGFSFGLPGGAPLDEKEHKGITHSLNLRFSKMGLVWTVRYSQNKKMFICVPKKLKQVSGGGRRYKTESYSERNEKILAMRSQGIKGQEIADQLGITKAVVYSVVSDARIAHKKGGK